MKTKLIICLLLLASPLFAEHFPICMYGVNNPEDIPLLKKAGFNCIQTYHKSPEKLAPLAQSARENGMAVVFYAEQVIGSEYQNAAKDWPILAWYLVDEPNVHKWLRQRVAYAHYITQTAFPMHKTTLVIGEGKTNIPYYDLSDTLMVDWYPVPHLALTSFGDNVRFAKEGQKAMNVGHRPLWGVVQIFNWKEYKQYRPDNDRIGRFPTEDEIRFMSYDGIVNGAEGLFYFIFTTYNKTLPQAQPEWWARVEAVSKELNKLLPVLENGTLTENPVSVPEPLAAQTRLYKKNLYIILINRSDKPVDVPPALLKRKYKSLFGTKKTAQIPAYSVWVLKRKK